MNQSLQVGHSFECEIAMTPIEADDLISMILQARKRAAYMLRGVTTNGQAS